MEITGTKKMCYLLVILFLTGFSLADNHTNEQTNAVEAAETAEQRAAPTLSKTTNFYLALWTGAAGLLLIIIFLFFFFKKPKDPWKKKLTEQGSMVGKPPKKVMPRPPIKRGRVLPPRKY